MQGIKKYLNSLVEGQLFKISQTMLMLKKCIYIHTLRIKQSKI